MKKMFLTAVMAVIMLILGQNATAVNVVASDSDSIAAATAVEDSIKMEGAMPDMLSLVAHFEGVKVRAYWDKAARKWTIGIGNTVRPDGRRVSARDRINDKEMLMKYFSSHVRKYIWKDMRSYLKLEEMSEQQIAAIGSLCYNCGSGILRNGNQPSLLALAINDYVETGSDEAKARVKQLMDKKTTARGRRLDVLVKRRTVEEMVFFGEITMVDNSEYAIENSVNFAEASLGATYGIKVGEFGDVMHVVDSLNNCRGRNLEDSILYAFNHPNTARKASARKFSPRRARR